MQEKHEEIGQRDGCSVSASTDAVGSHVVVTGSKHLICPCRSHQAAVHLARKVIKEGFTVCLWRQPMATLFDVAAALVSGQGPLTPVSKGDAISV